MLPATSRPAARQPTTGLWQALHATGADRPPAAVVLHRHASTRSCYATIPSTCATRDSPSRSTPRSSRSGRTDPGAQAAGRAAAAPVRVVPHHRERLRPGRHRSRCSACRSPIGTAVLAMIVLTAARSSTRPPPPPTCSTPRRTAWWRGTRLYTGAATSGTMLARRSGPRSCGARRCCRRCAAFAGAVAGVGAHVGALQRLVGLREPGRDSDAGSAGTAPRPRAGSSTPTPPSQVRWISRYAGGRFSFIATVYDGSAGC